jgi:WD40 repeat protein
MNVDLKAGIVRVIGPDGETVGTGFVVTDEGLIATCAHVVEAAGAGPGDTVRVAFHATGEEREAQVEPDWWRGPDAEDVAILRLDGPLPEGVTSLPLGSSNGTSGHPFRTFGFPAARPEKGMWGYGTIGDPVPDTTERDLLQLTGATEVTPGFSGAPVWHDDIGVVVGMVVSITRPDAYGRMVETAFIIPVETLRDVCPALRLPVECPYRGLQVFEREHADLYFGREVATQELMAMLSQRDFVALVGVSGSGKSSLVRAGLEKGLRSHKIPGLAERLRCLAVPGRSPMFNLVLALANLPALGPKAVAWAFDLPMEALTQEGEARRQAAQTLDRHSPASLAEGLRAVAPPEGLLLIVDQFERLYTECPDQEVQDRFVETLLQGAGDKVKVLLALRADFYGLALLHPALEQVVKQGGQMTLGRMKEAELRAAIEEPARRMGRGLQPGLVERLIADVRGQAGDLPLLEFTLTELWEQDNQKGMLTLATYGSLGYESPDGQRFPGVQGAIARRAEGVWRKLDDDERQAAERVFLGLVVPGAEVEGEREKTEDASRRAWQAEWDEATRRVAEKLVKARLLTTGQDPVSGQSTVEVSHEALIQAWPRLKQWVTDYHPFMQWYQEFAPFMQRWLDHNRHLDLLLPEPMLPLAQEWLRRYPIFLRGNPEDYIRRSQERLEAERKAQERRRRRITLAAVGAAVVFLVLALLAWGQRNTAVTEAIAHATAQAQAERLTRAARASELATQAQATLQEHPQRSLLLAIEALKVTMLAGDPLTAGAHGALRQALAYAGGRGLGGHKDSVCAVAFSPDNHWLVTGSADATTRLWDLTTSDPTATSIVLRGHESGVTAAAISPDSHWLVTGSEDNTARLWDLTTPNPAAGSITIRPRAGAHSASVVAISPDSKWLVTGGFHTFAHLWNLTAPVAAPIELWGHENSINAVAFNHDSRWLVTGSDDHTARLWDLIAPDPAADPIVLRGHGDSIRAVAISPDNHWLVTGSADRTARLWDLTAPDPAATPIVLRGHEGWIWAIAISPDSHWLATGSSDGTARLWNLTAPDPAATAILLRGHESGITAAAISPDSHWLVTGSGDNTARLWDLTASDPNATSIVLHGHEDSICAIAISPNNRLLVTGSVDQTARLWDLTPPDMATVPIVLRGYNGPIVSVTFGSNDHWVAISPDNHWLATGSHNGDAHLWDLTAPNPAVAPVVLRRHGGLMPTVAISPDGRWLVTNYGSTTAAQGDIHLWDLTAPDPAVDPIVLRGHQGSIQAAAISPDSHWLVTTGGFAQYEVRLWDLTTRDLAANPIVLRGHEDSISTIAISPGSRWLVTGSSDGTARLWDLSAPDPAATSVVLRGHERWIGAIAASSDCHWLATGSGDGTARLWDLTAPDPAADPIVLRGHKDSIRTIAISPDSRWLVTGSSDGAARLWDLRAPDTAAASVVLRGHTDKIVAVDIGPEGGWLVSASWDGVARLWTLRLDELVDLACRTAGRNLTTEEWEQYFPREKYRKTCLGLPALTLIPTASPTPTHTPLSTPTPMTQPFVSPLPAPPSEPFASPLPVPMESPLMFDPPLPASPMPSVSQSPNQDRRRCNIVGLEPSCCSL